MATGGRLQHALRRGRDDQVEALRELGAPPDSDGIDVALHAMASGGGPVPALPELDDDAQNCLVELAMHDAATLSRVIDAVGPDFSAQWGGGPRGTLLHQASWFGRPDYVEILLRRGATPDARAQTDYPTPLGWAVVGSRYGPGNPDAAFTPLEADHRAVAMMLVAAGATVDPRYVETAVPPLSDWLATAR
jgi:ankyrin repeat protein